MKTISAWGVSVLLLVAGTAPAQEFGPWSRPVNLGPVVNSASDDMHPALSKDGLSMIFSSNRPGGAGGLDMWVTQRDSLDDPWQTPRNLAMLNSAFDDYSPDLTTDGHWVFFHSNRPGGCNSSGRFELWAAHRQNKRDDFGWEPPVNLGCTLNTAGADNAGPTFWEDNSTGILYLYFTRNVTPANPNGFDIYVSTCTSDIDSCNRRQLWEPALFVAELNTPLRDTRTAIRRRDGLEMIITSNRAGTLGGLDLWVSTRPSAQNMWSVPIDLGPVVNSAANDGAPALSWDGQTMIFYSNRPGGLGGNDLYMCTRERLNDPERRLDSGSPSGLPKAQ